MSLIIFEYFWLITALFVGLGNVVMFKINSLKQIAAGNITRDETNKFIKWWLAWVLIPCIAFWILQTSPGHPTQVDFMSWGSNNKYLAMALIIVLWTSLLIWVLSITAHIPSSNSVRYRVPTSLIFTLPPGTLRCSQSLS